MYKHFFQLVVYKGLSFASSEINRILSDEDVELFVRMYVLLYADDTVVMAESAEELQAALDAVAECCDLWDLKVNISKTEIIIFSRGKVKLYPVFKLGSQTVKVVDEYVYLGITFNYNALWSRMWGVRWVQSKS